jgi:hypothetical protein
MLRRLRIAASMFFAAVAMALCVLCVRSYDRREGFMAFPFGYHVKASSLAGRLRFAVSLQSSEFNGWTSHSVRADSPENFGWVQHPSRTLGFEGGSSDWLTIGVPYWFVVMMSATAAAWFWPNWSRHFSLRTLVIATTLVAVLLGLGVCLVR